MITYRKDLQNDNRNLNNDVVFEHPPFDLKDRHHKITIHPLGDTRYWRFGLLFSETDNFHYEPAKGRYSNPGLKYIEIDVGEMTNGIWQLENRLQVSSRNITPEPDILYRNDHYTPLTEVNISLSLVHSDTALALSVSFNTVPLKSEVLYFPLVDHKFFKIAAWADERDFHVFATIQVKNIQEFAEFDSSHSPSTGPNKWLLKLNTITWDIANFTKGMHVWFGALTSKSIKRVEYDLFKQVAAGDNILGMAVGGYEAIACLFEVEKALHDDGANGEVIALKIIHVFTPYIQFIAFKGSLFIAPALQAEFRQRLISLSENNYREIIARDYQLPKIDLLEVERRYMEIVYQKLLAGEEIKSQYESEAFWKTFPKSFKPEKMNPLLLIAARNITLWGLSQIHPESTLFEKTDRTLFAIQAVFSTGKHLKEMHSAELEKINPDITRNELRCILNFMPQMPYLVSMSTMAENGYQLTFMDERIYETYRNYNGLKDLLKAHLEQYGVNTSGGIIRTEATTSAMGVFFNKTKVTRHKKDDLLPVMGVLLLAEDMASLLHDFEQESGQMIGIFGKWGRGKTYLLDKMWELLQLKPGAKYRKIVYDAWQYQETPASWAYLYETVAKAYLGKKRWLYIIPSIPYYFKLVKLNIGRLGMLPILKMMVAIAAAVAGWYLVKAKIPDYIYLYLPTSIILMLPLFASLKNEYSTKAIDLVKKYSVRHNYKISLGLQADIQEELIKLLKIWIPKIQITGKTWIRKRKLFWKFSIPEIQTKKKRILLLVEDLDRCNEEKIIQHIDALRVMLEVDEISERLLIVTAIDERILKRAIQLKYATLINEQHSGNPLSTDLLVGEYMDKLFISAVKLGELSKAQREEFAKELLKQQTDWNNEPKSGSDEFTYVKTDKIKDKNNLLEDVPEADTIRETTSLQIDFNNGEARKKYEVEQIRPAGGVLPIPPEWQKLNAKENAALINLYGNWELMTPRKICIFYYRYLLCKNMLISQYYLDRRDNIWQNEAGIHNLLEIMKKVSAENDPEKISTAKTQLLQSESFSDDELCDPFKIDIKASKINYLRLLAVLETVVAY